MEFLMLHHDDDDVDDYNDVFWTIIFIILQVVGVLGLVICLCVAGSVEFSWVEH